MRPCHSIFGPVGTRVPGGLSGRSPSSRVLVLNSVVARSRAELLLSADPAAPPSPVAPPSENEPAHTKTGSRRSTGTSFSIRNSSLPPGPGLLEFDVRFSPVTFVVSELHLVSHQEALALAHVHLAGDGQQEVVIADGDVIVVDADKGGAHWIVGGNRVGIHFDAANTVGLCVDVDLAVATDLDLRLIGTRHQHVARSAARNLEGEDLHRARSEGGRFRPAQLCFHLWIENGQQQRPELAIGNRAL